MRIRNEGLGEVGTAMRNVLAGSGARPINEVTKSKGQGYGCHNSKGYGSRGAMAGGKRSTVVMRR
ncbi:hypothetical protein [Methylobacterium sp.]|uniref:hypothetical protein n=1 Tax=Methylobacterium sp. TaxID=409 RepID=UPI003B02D0D9